MGQRQSSGQRLWQKSVWTGRWHNQRAAGQWCCCCYSQYKNYDTGKTADLSRFADGEQISSWAAPALTWANAEGLITGRGKTTMAPQGTVTRAEAAAILMRYMQTVDKDNNQ